MSSITRFVAPSLNFAKQASSTSVAALVGACGMELLKYAVQNQFQLFQQISTVAENVFFGCASGRIFHKFIRNPQQHDPATDIMLGTGTVYMNLQANQKLAGFWVGAMAGSVSGSLYSYGLMRDEVHLIPNIKILGTITTTACLGEYFLSQGEWERGREGLLVVGALGAGAIHLAGKISSAMGYHPLFLQSALLIGTLAPEAFPRFSTENKISLRPISLLSRLNGSSTLLKV